MKSFSAGKRTAKPGTVRRKAAGVGLRQTPVIAQDADAQDALAWLAQGMPEGEIAYDDAAPRLTKEQLAEFEPARFVVRQRRK